MDSPIVAEWVKKFKKFAGRYPKKYFYIWVAETERGVESYLIDQEGAEKYCPSYKDLRTTIHYLDKKYTFILDYFTGHHNIQILDVPLIRIFQDLQKTLVKKETEERKKEINNNNS